MGDPSESFVAWLELIERLQAVGLLRQLSPSEVMRTVGPRGMDPPDSKMVMDWLRAYYGGQGDPVESLWRCQAEGFVGVEDHAEPETVVAEAAHALPTLAALKAFRTDEALVLSTDEDHVALCTEIRHARVPSRSRRVPDTRPESVFGAINMMLGRLSAPRRFVPLRSLGDWRGYVAVSVPAARLLATLELTRFRGMSLLQYLAADGPAPVHDTRLLATGA